MNKEGRFILGKKTAAVLFGAVSSEYEVSLRSAASVLRNFPRDRYDVIMLGITKDGRWLEYTGDIDLIERDEWSQSPHAHPAILSPDRSHSGLLRLSSNARAAASADLGGNITVGSAASLPLAEASTVKIDVAFPVMHGEHAEDGTLQGLLEVAGIPYVGCGVLSSAACMDKAVTHALLESAGIEMTPWVQVFRWEMGSIGDLAPAWEARLGYPMFVKPANTGSSVGVSKVRDRIELVNALQDAFRYDRKAIVEQAIRGKELECAVLGNYTRAEASVVGEIVPHHEFYDYDGKYLDDSTDLFIPARISEEDSNRLQEAAVKAFRVMGCTGMARVDFFLREDGHILVNELNTIPGFTSISMYPKLFAAAGVPYPELIARLLALASEQE